MMSPYSPGILVDVACVRQHTPFRSSRCCCRGCSTSTSCCLSVLLQDLVADAVNHLIEIVRLIALLVAEGVAGRIVEHHDVVELHVAQALYTAVIPVRPLHVALHVDQRHGVLGERHGERSLRDARTIAYLAHEEIVAREETSSRDDEDGIT